MSHNKESGKKEKEKKEIKNSKINEKDRGLGTGAEKQNSEQIETEEKSVEKRLAEAQTEIEELKDRLLRQMAEFDNYRKRTVKEKAEIIKNGSADVITDILPIIDDMERAIASSGESEDFYALKDGIEIIYNKMMHTLEQKGLQKISPKNEPFDTDYHEAIALIPSTDENLKGHVIDCAIDGYKFNDKVLRHAKVTVAQ